MLTGSMIDQTNEDYHKGQGYSSTNIIDCHQYSEQHMKYWKENQTEPTPSMVEGTMLHEALLEPDKFAANYFVADGRSKEGKALMEANSGKTKCSQNTMDKIIAMRDSILANTPIKRFMDGALIEKSFYWRDVDTGVLCKAKPDIYNQKLKVIFDVKTIDSGLIWNVKKNIRAYNYHISAAFYKNGIQQAIGQEINEFAFIFIEKERPHGVRMVILSIDDMQKGFDEYKLVLERIAKAEKTNVWPGYPNEFVEINVFNEGVQS